MSTVRDMIRKKGGEIFSVTSTMSVFEALELMARHNTGALVVASGKKIEGIISERDCVRKMDLLGRNAKSATVGEIMTDKVIYVDASQPLDECMELMIDKNIRHLPVMDDKELIGLISVRDVLREVVVVQKDLIAQLEHYITG
ncbi:MAG: CBS domain-containing protein [Anaerolineales bacterium]|nr:CBS domain-containing protein [Anaerolineales bacterium]